MQKLPCKRKTNILYLKIVRLVKIQVMVYLCTKSVR